jgi:hypothetical protein
MTPCREIRGLATETGEITGEFLQNRAEDSRKAAYLLAILLSTAELTGENRGEPNSQLTGQI